MNQWPLSLPLCSVADSAFAAIFVVRARTARKANSQDGLQAAIEATEASYWKAEVATISRPLADIRVLGSECQLRAQPVNSVFSLRARAAQKPPHMQSVLRLSAAKEAAVQDMLCFAVSAVLMIGIGGWRGG